MDNVSQIDVRCHETARPKIDFLSIQSKIKIMIVISIIKIITILLNIFHNKIIIITKMLKLIMQMKMQLHKFMQKLYKIYRSQKKHKNRIFLKNVIRIILNMKKEIQIVRSLLQMQECRNLKIKNKVKKFLALKKLMKFQK